MTSSVRIHEQGPLAPLWLQRKSQGCQAAHPGSSLRQCVFTMSHIMFLNSQNPVIEQNEMNGLHTWHGFEDLPVVCRLGKCRNRLSTKGTTGLVIREKKHPFPLRGRISLVDKVPGVTVTAQSP